MAKRELFGQMAKLAEDYKRDVKKANERIRRLEKKYGEKAKGESFAYKTAKRIVGESKGFSKAIPATISELEKQYYQVSQFLEAESSTLEGVKQQDVRREQGFFEKLIFDETDARKIRQGQTKAERNQIKQELIAYYKTKVDIGEVWKRYKQLKEESPELVPYDSDEVIIAINQKIQMGEPIEKYRRLFDKEIVPINTDVGGLLGTDTKSLLDRIDGNITKQGMTYGMPVLSWRGGEQIRPQKSRLTAPGRTKRR